jgi:hypothetical protein
MWTCFNAPWHFSRSLFISHCSWYSEGVEFVDEVQLCVFQFTQINASKFLFLMHQIINLVNLLTDNVEIVGVLTEQLGIILRSMTYETLICVCTEINLQNDRRRRCLYCNCILLIFPDKICIGHSSTYYINTHTPTHTHTHTHTHMRGHTCLNEPSDLSLQYYVESYYTLTNFINLLGY